MHITCYYVVNSKFHRVTRSYSSHLFFWFGVIWLRLSLSLYQDEGLFPDHPIAQFMRMQLVQFLHTVMWSWRRVVRNDVRKRQTKGAVEQTASIYDRFACKLCWRLPGHRTLPTHRWTNSQQSTLLSFTFKQRAAPRLQTHKTYTISHIIFIQWFLL